MLIHVASGAVVVTCLLLDQRFAGSNPADGDGFLMAIKFRSVTSIGGEVKPSAPCKILRHVNIAAEFEIHTSSAKFSMFLSRSSCFVTRLLLVILPVSSGGRMRSFSVSTSFCRGSSCSYIAWRMKYRPLGGRSSETQSYKST
jgi:hypothetical protein